MEKMSIDAHSIDTLDGQKDNLFILLMIFMMPLSLIVFLPGIQYSFKVGLEGMAYTDIVCLFTFLLIATPLKISLKIRKIIFLIGIYTIAIITTYYVGLSGPGMLYLLTALIFGIIFMPKNYALTIAHVNSIIYISFAVLIYSDLVNWHIELNRDSLLEEYIQVVVNFIFLSYVFATLIPFIWSKLDTQIREQKILSGLILSKNIELKIALDKIEYQKNEITNFSFLASHDLMEPLRMIRILSDKLLSGNNTSQLSEDSNFFLKSIMTEGKKMSKMLRSLENYSFFQQHNFAKVEFKLSEIIDDVLGKLKIEFPYNTFRVDLRIDNNLQLLPKQIIEVILSEIMEIFCYQKAQNETIEFVAKAMVYEKTNRIDVECISTKLPNEIQSYLKDKSKKTILHGTQMGIMTIHKIIEELGGQLIINNENVESDCVSILLPIQISD